MGFLDRIAEMHIKKDESGNEVFYPNGLLGKGYVLTNEETKKKIRSFSKKSSVWTFLLIFLGITIGWIVPILLMIPFLGIYYFFLSKHIKKLEVSTLGLTLSERIKVYADTTNISMLLFCFIVSIGFIYITVFLILNDSNGEPSISILYILGILFFGTGGIFFGWMILKKWKSKPNET